VYAVRRESAPVDADAALYDGFFSDQDKRRFASIRATAPEYLGQRDIGFSDPRLPELLFRYRARNWPQTLAADERQRWDDYRRRRLLDDSAMLGELTLPQYQAQIAQLRSEHADNPVRLGLLDALEAWGNAILPP